MSVSCQSVPRDIAGHAAIQEDMKPSDCRDVMTLGRTGHHEI